MTDEYSVAEGLGYKANKLDMALKAHFARSIRKSGHDITPEQWGALSYLTFHDGAKQSDLAKISFRDQTSVTRLVDGLERIGLVIRKNDESDRRVCRICLTAKGKETHARILPYAKECNDFVAGLFSDQEFKKLSSLIDRAITGIIDENR